VKYPWPVDSAGHAVDHLIEPVVGGFGQSLGGAGSVPGDAFRDVHVIRDDMMPALYNGQQLAPPAFER